MILFDATESEATPSYLAALVPKFTTLKSGTKAQISLETTIEPCALPWTRTTHHERLVLDIGAKNLGTRAIERKNDYWGKPFTEALVD